MFLIADTIHREPRLHRNIISFCICRTAGGREKSWRRSGKRHETLKVLMKHENEFESNIGFGIICVNIDFLRV